MQNSKLSTLPKPIREREREGEREGEGGGEGQKDRQRQNKGGRPKRCEIAIEREREGIRLPAEANKTNKTDMADKNNSGDDMLSKV